MFILIWNENTNDLPFIVWKFNTKELANNAMLEKAKEECYRLWLLEWLDTWIDIEDDIVKEYRKNNSLLEFEWVEVWESFIIIENSYKTIWYIIEEI